MNKYSRRTDRWLRYFYSVLIVLFLTATLSSTLSAAPAGGKKGKYRKVIHQFQAYVNERMAFEKAVGLSVGFFKDGFTWSQGFGYANLENKSPALPESSYRLASITKTFTAVAILQLMEQGKLDLDAEVQTYVPYFPKKKWPLTVRMLLGHLGGISHYKNYDKEGSIREHKTTRQSLEIFKDWDLVAEPGTRYQYSSYGYNLLGAVVEGASGKSFGDYTANNIFKPLGMNSTIMDTPKAVVPHRVRGYRLENGEVVNSEYVNMSSRFAGGGTRSTVKDLLTYARGILAHKLIKKETFELMTTSMKTGKGRLTGYGMGWNVFPLNGHFRISHSGAQQETRTYLMIFPNQNLAIALGSNFEDISLYPYVLRLAELVLGEDFNRRVYAPDPDTRALLRACERVFNYGAGYYDRYKKPLTRDKEQLKEAFEFFNRWAGTAALRKDRKEAGKKLGEGIHEGSGRAFTKIGSYMASVLAEKYGAGGMARFRRLGFLPFFGEYVGPAASSEGLRFSSTFTSALSAWNKDWESTYTKEMRELEIMPGTGFQALGARLKKVFGKAFLYPDFSGQVISLAQPMMMRGESGRSFGMMKVCKSLYPGSPDVLAKSALAYLMREDEKSAVTARGLFEEVRSIDPDAGSISINWMRAYGYILLQGKKKKGFERFVEIAGDLYPKSARLHFFLGNLYLDEGRIKEAEKLYRKSFALGLGFGKIREVLDRLEEKKAAGVE